MDARARAAASGGVRVLFIVGKDNAENSPDVLPVDVKEGAFMRSKTRQGQPDAQL